MKRKIGVIDSGIGGLTVVSSLQKMLPNEDLIYLGDNKNIPYGNRSKDEILNLTINLLNFMKDNDVKLVAVACNTISTLIKEYEHLYDFAVMDIISPTIDHVIDMGTYNISILATEFTIKTEAYQNKLLKRNPDLSITSEGSKTLASLIDSGKFDSEETFETVQMHIKNLNDKGDIYNLILGCTHFPIVSHMFTKISPHMELIDPGFELSKKIRKYLDDNNLHNSEGEGTIDIYTTGSSTEIFELITERLKIKNILGINTI